MRFIAQHVQGPLELEALRLAADEVKKGENVTLYNEVRPPSTLDSSPSSSPDPPPGTWWLSVGP